MKRDMDLIRELLIAIEQDPQYNATDLFAFNEPADLGITSRSVDEVAYHLQMLIDSGLITGKRSMTPIYGALTMAGHDFLDSVRDSAIWTKTKETASQAGGFSLRLLGEIATGLIKTQVEKHTGVKL